MARGVLERAPGKEDNWVERRGGLPKYISQIAEDLHTERGMTISRAIATAISQCKKWAAGDKDVKPATRVKAQRAIAEWEKLKISKHGDKGKPGYSILHPRSRGGAAVWVNGPRGTSRVSALEERSEQGITIPAGEMRIEYRTRWEVSGNYGIQSNGRTGAAQKWALSYFPDGIANRRRSSVLLGEFATRKDAIAQADKIAASKYKQLENEKNIGRQNDEMRARSAAERRRELARDLGNKSSVGEVGFKNTRARRKRLHSTSAEDLLNRRRIAVRRKLTISQKEEDEPTFIKPNAAQVAAGKAATRQYNMNERKYAESVVRLASKGELPDDDKREDLADRWNTTPERLQSIEDSIHTAMGTFLVRDTPLKELRNTGLSVKAQKSVSAAGGTKTHDLGTGERLFRANKGPFAGQWVRVDRNGTIYEVDQDDAAADIALIYAEKYPKKEKEQPPQSEASARAQFRREAAARWAKNIGLDNPNDPYWVEIFWGSFGILSGADRPREASTGTPVNLPAAEVPSRRRKTQYGREEKINPKTGKPFKKKTTKKITKHGDPSRPGYRILHPKGHIGDGTPGGEHKADETPSRRASAPRKAPAKATPPPKTSRARRTAPVPAKKVPAKAAPKKVVPKATTKPKSQAPIKQQVKTVAGTKVVKHTKLGGHTVLRRPKNDAEALKAGIPPAYLKLPNGKPNPDVWVPVDTSVAKIRYHVTVHYPDGRTKNQGPYVEEAAAVGQVAKHNRVKEIAPMLPKIQKQLEADAAKGNSVATAILVAIETGIRNGTSGNRQLGAEQSFGITQILGKHLTFKGKKAVFTFTGKHGVPQVQEVENPVAVAALRKLKTGSNANSRLFATDDSKTRAYMKKATGRDDVLMHDLRTGLATKMAYDLVNSYPHPATKREFTQFQREIATIVSERLGNTPAQALKTYIAPEVWDLFVIGG